MTGEEFFGGSKYVNLSATTELRKNVRFWIFDPDANFINLQMPDATRLKTGGPQFYLHNVDVAHTIYVNTYNTTGGTIGNVPPTKLLILLLTDNTTAAGNWEWIGVDLFF
jgi:hypothetical protein